MKTFVEILRIIFAVAKSKYFFLKSANLKFSKSGILILWISFHASAAFFLKEYVP